MGGRRASWAAWAAAWACSAVLGIPELVTPIAGLKLSDLRDSYSEIHNGHAHEAIDIMVPRGTPVRAVVPGTIRKLFLSQPGGNTIYLVDNTNEYCFYYAHLDGYAPALREGGHVAAGETIGWAGSTGNADPRAPHLHFAVFRLGAGKEWWKGVPLNPYESLAEALKRSQRE